ncbi:hypothetical protein [Glycomyces sp. NPDC047010]|uniref:hypothetical protein n=1 Tax=Glycomyces sp. NPDC047010 TaxID=3155023 RepID=UPI003401B931
MVHPLTHVGEAIHNRLGSLGLDWEILDDAFTFGLEEASTCTDRDAGFCKGVMLYSRLGRRLQERLSRFDWIGGRPHNQQCVWSLHAGVRVLHVTGNVETGNPDPSAQVAPERPGGSARRDLILMNAQRSLFDELDPGSGFRELKTWFLLYRMGKSSLRSELSYTENLSDDGGGISWSERIILPEVPLPAGLGMGDDRWAFDHIASK